MSEVNREHEKYAKHWFAISTKAVLSLWHKDLKSFIRSTSHTTNNKTTFFPLASFHSISSLSNCGINPLLGDQPAEAVGDSYFNIPGPDGPTPQELISSINGHAKRKAKNWVIAVLGQSSHTDTLDVEHTHSPRVTIVLERLLATLVTLFVNDYNKSNLSAHEKFLRIGLDECDKILSQFDNNVKFYPSPGLSPLPVVNYALCVLYQKKIYKTIYKKDFIKRDKNIIKIVAILENHINYHVARYQLEQDTSFDPVSLSTALFGLSQLRPEWKKTAFFQSTLEIVMKSQYSNGCWPTGASLTFSPTGDVVQQPSVGVAVTIAEAAIDRSFLVDNHDDIGRILNMVLPGLRKMAKYLEVTYEKNVTYEGENRHGWSSDRIGERNYVEAWITALSNRFFYRLWIAEKAYLRHQSLKKLGLPEFRSKLQSVEQSRTRWEKEVIEPDQIIKPKRKIYEKFIDPVLSQKAQGATICLPVKDGVSFIIFGPPGTGKTYFIEQIAKVLNWPLVELSPGHFIKNGLELIESTSKEIFELLDNINHAIVFFDECDELFKERDVDTSSTRSILSFATASMLPKIQKLHDSRNFIFVLGTNFLSNIDTAIRRPGRFDEILLYDRADTVCREKIIKARLKKLTPKDLQKKLSDTQFFTVKELNQYLASSEGADALLAGNTVDEYKDWCNKTGVKEINATRLLSKEKIDIITNRWGIQILKES